MTTLQKEQSYTFTLGNLHLTIRSDEPRDLLCAAWEKVVHRFTALAPLPLGGDDKTAKAALLVALSYAVESIRQEQQIAACITELDTLVPTLH